MVISQKIITLIAEKPPGWEKINKKRETKHLGINVPKAVKDLYLEKIIIHYKLKKIKIKFKKIKLKKGLPWLWIRRIDIVKINMLSKAIHILNAIAMKRPGHFPQN